MKNIFCLLFFCFAFLSCKKNQLGGTSTINGTVIHHSNKLPAITVYIKFKAKEFPGEDTGKYDSKVTSDANGNFSIQCYKGDYYLYAYGYDAAYKAYASGGVPVHMRKNETREIELAVDEKQ